MTLDPRDFPYPLNVFLHVLTREEGAVAALHYGLFASKEESIGAAQDRSTALLIDRLPPPPASLLEVGIGLGSTLDRLTRLGYDAEGIGPDEQQVAAARSLFGPGLRVHVALLEAFEATRRFDAIVFQESSQYIESNALFGRTRRLAAPGAAVVVLDEFALRPVERPGALHRLDHFLEASEREGFRAEEEVDLSRAAAPTVDYFLERLPRHQDSLHAELDLSDARIEALIENGKAYRDLYASGAYGYRLLRFRAPARD
jgi:cyclopropane fatty-acyl-phospholipid synthase-like methyltransferase